MIRAFRNEDLQACVDLIVGCLGLDASLAPSTRARFGHSDLFRLIQQSAVLFHLVVYEHEGQIAGIGGVDLNEIRLLYVTPELQGRGIGRTLLNHLEEMVPSALFTNIFLYSTPGAEGFYKSRGYESRGEVCFEIKGETLPTIFMSKPLSVPEPRSSGQSPDGYSPWRSQKRI